MKKNLKKQQEIINNLRLENKNLSNQLQIINQKKLSDDLEMIKKEEAIKSLTFDCIFILDEILDNIKILTSDIKVLKNDLSIGSLTLEDRVDNFNYEIIQVKLKLENIKKDFYSNNKLKENS